METTSVAEDTVNKRRGDSKPTHPNEALKACVPVHALMQLDETDRALLLLLNEDARGATERWLERWASPKERCRIASVVSRKQA